MMACAGSELSTRMSTEDRNVDNKHICEVTLRHFRKCKVEISDAIKTTFPFLELLRDRGFITDKIYEDSQDSCRNLVSEQRVVYNVLSELEKTFDLSLLEALFCDVIMRNYPALNDIHKSFENVIKEAISHQAENVNRPTSQLSSQQGDCNQTKTDSHLLGGKEKRGTAPPEKGLSAHLCETEQINARRNVTVSDNSDALESQPANEQCALESEPAMRKHEDSAKSCVKGETPGACSYTLGSGAKEGTVDHGNNSVLNKNARKKRRPRIPRDESVDFHSEILPVTCGEMKGMLHKNKLKQGATVKCIRREDGQWFTPREFEVAGGHKTSSNWKLSVRCGGNTLKWLMEENFLPTPPRSSRRKRKQENSDECEVCQDGGTLFCCDTCSRSFHEDCHIPPVETERNPWSCTFCRMRAFSGHQQHHRESEVLARRMGPEEQLKCEFLLLKVYCQLESFVLKGIPPDDDREETCPCIRGLMVFNEIKEKLNGGSYPGVKNFVWEVCLVFHKHRSCKECSYFVRKGTQLLAEFEKNFQEVFAIQDTN